MRANKFIAFWLFNLAGYTAESTGVLASGTVGLYDNPRKFSLRIVENKYRRHCGYFQEKRSYVRQSVTCSRLWRETHGKKKPPTKTTTKKEENLDLHAFY